MAVARPSGASTALAVREASPRVVAKYLSALKPILSHATDARGLWVRYLNELAKRPDLASAHTEAVQFALARAQQFHEARRQIGAISVAPGFETMHRAVDAWLGELTNSCEALVRAPAPINQEAIAQVNKILREAAAKADEFNSERAAAVTAIQEAQTPPPPNRPKVVASKREMRILVIMLVVALLFFVGVGVVLSSLSSTAADPVAKPKPSSGDVERRVFTQPQVLDRLRQEIQARQVAFQDADVRLVEPDLVVVTGRIQGPVTTIPVEAEIQMSVTDDGKPRVAAKRLSAIGVQVPQEAVDALNRRAEEANRVLPEQVAPGQRLVRLFVENNQVIAEIARAPGAPAKPGDAAPAETAPEKPPAKPGA